MAPLNTMFDVQNRRAIVVNGHDFTMTFTTVQDLAAVVAKAVTYDGEWPVIGGIRGNSVKVSQILKIGEKVRGMPFRYRRQKAYLLTGDLGRPFAIDTVELGDLEAGILKTSWTT